jgi:hypothetical protein
MTEDECSRLVSELPRLPAETLHEFARSWNFDAGLGPLAQLIRLPNCELATAKLVYWLLEPEWHLQFKDRAHVPGFAQEGFDLVQEIERRVREGQYREDRIAFDPAHYELRSGKVVNFTKRHLGMEDQFVRELPGEMYQPSGPGAAPRPPGRPTFTGEERADSKRKLADRARQRLQRTEDLKERIAAMEKARKNRS